MQPKRFADIIGQDRVMTLLRKECQNHDPRHQLLYGPPGLGKTTLAQVQSNECKLTFVYMQAGKLLTPKRVAAQLMDLPTTGYGVTGQAGSGAARYLLLLDECHMLHDFDQWHPILSSRELTPDPYGGVSWLPHITVVAATNYPDRLPEPFKSRFALKLRLDPYEHGDLMTIVRRSYKGLTDRDAFEIARRARGSARAALDFAETVIKHGLSAFEALEIDSAGLQPLDRAYLAALQRAGRPLALNTVAAMVQEDPQVIRREVEPYLLRLGLITIGPKGRELISVEVRGSRGRIADAEAEPVLR